jgi:hypothetical protein
MSVAGLHGDMSRQSHGLQDGVPRWHLVLAKPELTSVASGRSPRAAASELLMVWGGVRVARVARQIGRGWGYRSGHRSYPAKCSTVDFIRSSPSKGSSNPTSTTLRAFHGKRRPRVRCARFRFGRRIFTNLQPSLDERSCAPLVMMRSSRLMPSWKSRSSRNSLGLNPR